jgi:glycosyltransferase involved in cell wall biosynthesis
MTSRLVPEKGCDVSVQAFARVLRRMPDAQLHVYGDGPERDRLHRLVSDLGIGRAVQFHGYLDERCLATVLPDYDVFLQHSLDREGFGVSITEASACGLPVVVTAVGGIAEQVVDWETGLFVPQRDPAAMAATMLTLAGNADLRRRLGEAGRRRAVEAYDAVRQTRRSEQVLLSAAAAGRVRNSR